MNLSAGWYPTGSRCAAMTLHDTLIRAGNSLVMAVQGEPQAALYKRPDGTEFKWDAVVGAEKGSVEFGESGTAMKVYRLTLRGPVDQLTQNKVTELERFATVTVAGHTYAIDPDGSTWGPNSAILSLVRKVASRHRDGEGRRGAV